MASANSIILMGVSGCGKSSVGLVLEEKLGWKFFDGDDFHPQMNIDKMASGKPLNDTDRQPWLERLRELIVDQDKRGEPIILACSALKARYRDVLQNGNPGLVFVHLEGSFELILERMRLRAGHYMKAEMLKSQFDALERLQNGIRIDIDQTVEEIVDEIIGRLDGVDKEAE